MKPSPPSQYHNLLTALSGAMHKCERGALLQCCQQLRCEACHVLHLREEHSRGALLEFWRFHMRTSIIVDEVKPPRTKGAAPAAVHVDPQEASEEEVRDFMKLLKSGILD